MHEILERSNRAIRIIEKYISKSFQDKIHHISSKPSKNKVPFFPKVFQIPGSKIDNKSVALMTPLRDDFNAVYETIVAACKKK